METFVYDAKQSYEANYARWRIMNSDERQDEQQRLYSNKEAKEVFDKQYKDKVWRKKEDWIKDHEPETEDFEKIESVLAVYMSFVLDLKPIIPTRILDQMINVEIALRLHAKELEENNGPLSS